MVQISKKDLIHQAKIEKSKRSFWGYCSIMYSSFYREERKYLKNMCLELQNFYNDDTEFMLINAPP